MQLDFYYDIVCPYAYLASTQVRDLAQRTGADLRYRPMLLGGVFKAIGAPVDQNATMSPAKARHNLMDMHRWAERFEVELTMPDGHPRRTILPMRCIVAALGADRISASDALFAAYWVDGLDVTDANVVTDVLTRAGLDGAALVARASDDDIKVHLRTVSDEAVAAGVFGAPAFVVDGELFWGQDRMHFVERALSGWKA